MRFFFLLSRETHPRDAKLVATLADEEKSDLDLRWTSDSRSTDGDVGVSSGRRINEDESWIGRKIAVEEAKGKVWEAEEVTYVGFPGNISFRW